MLFGYIVDPETGKIVAVIRYGEVFRNDKEGARIATVVNANLYDLMGNFIGRLDDQHTLDVRTWSMPIAFRKLLQANPRATEKRRASADDIGAHGQVPTMPRHALGLREPS